jgi:hypothetical protein
MKSTNSSSGVQNEEVSSSFGNRDGFIWTTRTELRNLPGYQAKLPDLPENDPNKDEHEKEEEEVVIPRSSVYHKHKGKLSQRLPRDSLEKYAKSSEEITKQRDEMPMLKPIRENVILVAKPSEMNLSEGGSGSSTSYCLEDVNSSDSVNFVGESSRLSLELDLKNAAKPGQNKRQKEYTGAIISSIKSKESNTATTDESNINVASTLTSSSNSSTKSKPRKRTRLANKTSLGSSAKKTKEEEAKANNRKSELSEISTLVRSRIHKFESLAKPKRSPTVNRVSFNVKQVSSKMVPDNKVTTQVKRDANDLIDEYANNRAGIETYF